MAPLSLAQPLELHGAESSANQAVDVGSDGGEHPSDLALPSLADANPQPGAGLGPIAADLGWRRRAPSGEQPRRSVLELHTASQSLEGGSIRRRGDECRVLALVPVARMEDAVRPRPVIREQHQALRLDVQAPRGPEALGADVDERDDRAPAALVARGREEAAGLVDRQMDRRLR